jgi:hypothetical protein
VRRDHANAKIVVDLPADDSFGPYRTESLHAYDLGSGHYELMSVPLLANRLHLHDRVRCEPAVGTQVPRLVEVIEASGFGTVHLIPAQGAPPESLAPLIASVRELGCIVETGLGIIGIGVPPECDCDRVKQLLDSSYERGEISYEAEL